MMIPAELLRQVRRIEITTNRIVDEMMSGRYESAFKGHGMEFDEVREYQPGDEVRSIDWNVTARTGRPYIKRFVEERELTVMCLVDLSRSMAFGSVDHLKNRVATELCAVLAFSAIKNHDKIGLLVFTDKIERFIPPKKGSRHALRLIREVLSFEPTGHGTDIPAALDYLARVCHHQVVAFLLSDFFCDDLRVPLTLANKRHDVIAVHLVDPRQEALPPIGWIRLEDLEAGGELVLRSASAAIRRQYTAWALAHRERLKSLAQAAGVDLVEVRTDRPLIDPLLRFFRMRSLRR